TDDCRSLPKPQSSFSLRYITNFDSLAPPFEASMNVKQLNHFLAVLEHGSILKASLRLNLSQPALSKSIAGLEGYFGVPLFKRLPRGVEPTAFALALERHARRILTDFDT